MRVLHVVKTIEGARWAAEQARELVAMGVEVHVALPDDSGGIVALWRQAGVEIHVLAADLPVRAPHSMWRLFERVRDLVARVSPDLIHSHFVGTTLTLRYALGREHPVPRIFQVPGPLHMEHRLFRLWEISSAGPPDHWIASSRYVHQLYRRAGVPDERLFLSYYGTDLTAGRPEEHAIPEWRGIVSSQRVVGNVNHMYPPKRYLGQTKGLKRHEDVIDALGVVLARQSDVAGVLIGGQWGGGRRYEAALRQRAEGKGLGRIHMLGALSAEQARAAWAGFDLAVHVPSSENCGGVVEPLLAGVPVLAARTGGLPEVVIDGATGALVDSQDVIELARAIEAALGNLDRMREMALRGKDLVLEMFDVRRTAAEVHAIYQHLLNGRARQGEFDSRRFVAGL